MSAKQPLISLDRPNNTAAVQSLRSPDAIPADTASKGDGQAEVIANVRIPHAAKAPVRTQRKPAAISSPQASPQPVVSTPTPPTTIERIVTLGARIPASLHQRIKLYCVANDIEMQRFVHDALTEHLRTLQST